MRDMVKAIAAYDSPLWHTAGLAGSATSSRGPLHAVHDHSSPEASGTAATLGFDRSITLPDATDDDIGASSAEAALPLAVLNSAGNKRIHWASTETADAFSGHIEGALRAGLAPARSIQDL